jgi:hypothetical protein
MWEGEQSSWVLSTTGPGTGVRRLAEHSHSVANHRKETFDTRDQLAVLNLRRIYELCGDGGEILAHQAECALEILTLGPARASFAARFLNFREIYYLSHFLVACGSYQQSQLSPIDGAGGNRVAVRRPLRALTRATTRMSSHDLSRHADGDLVASRGRGVYVK